MAEFGNFQPNPQQQMQLAQMFAPNDFARRIQALQDPNIRMQLAMQLASSGQPPPPPEAFEAIVGSGSREVNALGVPNPQMQGLQQPGPQGPTASVQPGQAAGAAGALAQAVQEQALQQANQQWGTPPPSPWAPPPPAVPQEQNIPLNPFFRRLY